MDLDSVISVYKATHPNDGEVMVIGHLRANEINVPRERIRKSIHRVDPLDVLERRLTTIKTFRNITLKPRTVFAHGWEPYTNPLEVCRSRCH